MNLADMPDVLTPAEVMQILRMGRSKFYIAIREGQIPSIRLGRKILIPKAAIQEMLDGVTKVEVLR